MKKALATILVTILIFSVFPISCAIITDSVLNNPIKGLIDGIKINIGIIIILLFIRLLIYLFDIIRNN